MKRVASPGAFAPLGLLALGLLLGCGGDNKKSEALKIGVILPLTGMFGDSGPHERDALSLAVQEANAAGGILNGRQVEFLFVDDGTDPDRAEQEARNLLDTQRVEAIIGGSYSSASLKIEPLVAVQNKVQISCCSTSDDLSGPEHPNFFRTVPPDSFQAAVLAPYAIHPRAAADPADAGLGCEWLAVVHSDDSYGTPFGKAIQAKFESLGGPAVPLVAIDESKSNYSAEVKDSRLVRPAGKAACVALVMGGNAAGTFIHDWYSQAGRVPGDVQWIGTDATVVDGFKDNAADEVRIDNTVGTSPITAPDTPQYKTFKDDYQVFYSGEPPIYIPNQYDAAVLLLLAMEKAGKTSGDEVRAALLEVSRSDPGDRMFGPGELKDALAQLRRGGGVNYEGASGPVDFDDDGEVLTDYEIWKYVKGQGFQHNVLVVRHSDIMR